MKEKRPFCKTFHSMQNFLESQHLVDDLVDFLELSMFINIYTYVYQYIYLVIDLLYHKHIMTVKDGSIFLKMFKTII